MFRKSTFCGSLTSRRLFPCPADEILAGTFLLGGENLRFGPKLAENCFLKEGFWHTGGGGPLESLPGAFMILG